MREVRFVGAALGLLLWLLAAQPGLAQVARTTYVVQAGDSLSGIALNHGVSVDALARANDLSSADFIWVGQRLIIPNAATASSAPAVSVTTRAYVVEPGDTLASIALEAGVNLNALISLNGIQDPNLVRVGQKLLIPGPPSGTVAAGASLTQVRYTVKAGDTLGSIAARYDMTAAAIVRANGLASADLIRIGLELLIPSRQGGATSFTGRVSRFVVSIAQQRCWLYAGDNIVADWACSTGQRGAGTNAGSYTVQSKMERAYGSTWGIWMPYWLGIYWAGGSENGIHGIPFDAATGWRLWEGYVGTPVTYGCVLLDDDNARLLYDLAYIGMPVIVLP
jgi:LysM repeat protein